jgi:hypothetical protein
VAVARARRCETLAWRLWLLQGAVSLAVIWRLTAG